MILHRQREYPLKNRENLDFKNVVGKGGDLDVNVVQNWTENVLPSIFKDYAEDNIHNADETGLFYHMQPNKSIHFPEERSQRATLNSMLRQYVRKLY